MNKAMLEAGIVQFKSYIEMMRAQAPEYVVKSAEAFIADLEKWAKELPAA